MNMVTFWWLTFLNVAAFSIGSDGLIHSLGRIAALCAIVCQLIAIRSIAGLK